VAGLRSALPIRTITVMRRSFASILRFAASLFTSIDSIPEHDDLLRHADVLRDQVGRSVADVRSINSSVPYDFSAEREQHIATADTILRATLTTAALFWNQLASVHVESESTLQSDSNFRDFRTNLSRDLVEMADCIAE
jgi:multidrug resistance protein MdtO